MARRRGRPAASGKRKACGRLKARAAAIDHGNVRAQAARAAFAIFRDGKAGNELGDPIGKAWAAGLLEGFSTDGQAMRDAGRDFGQLWRSCFGDLGVRTSAPERLARSSHGIAAASSAEPSPAERRFERMRAIVAAHPLRTRAAFYRLCVECQDPDSVPLFVERLINERLALKGKRSGGSPPMPGDRALMEQAAEILEALVAGAGRRRVA